jgi:hypothetical protein
MRRGGFFAASVSGLGTLAPASIGFIDASVQVRQAFEGHPPTSFETNRLETPAIVCASFKSVRVCLGNRNHPNALGASKRISMVSISASLALAGF